jgi:uncharacterized protein YbaR (Trm112 family)
MMKMKPLATIKCPYCHGQHNHDRKTLYLYSTDTFWCARCKAYGVVSDIDPALLTGITPRVSTWSTVEKLRYNNAGDRFSVCKQRYSDASRDVFQIKLVDGSVVGHSIRYPDKRSKIEGIKGFCYREEYLDITQTYRLVEGPYDCIYPNDVAVLGYPTEYQAKQLKWIKQLILCPDGDVWLSKDNLIKWLAPFDKFKTSVVEYIPNSLDPDECRQEDRKQVSLRVIKEWLNNE